MVLQPAYSLADDDDGADVLFDVTKEMDIKYGNPVVQDKFLDILDGAGITYEFTPDNVTLDEMFLNKYKILVIWDPEGTYSEEEKAAIHEFVNGGGALLFLGASYFDTVDVVFDDLNELLSPYGIQLAKRRVIDLTDYFGCHCGTTPLISNFAQDSFFYNVDELAFRHTSALEITGPAFAIAMGDDDAFIDENSNEMLDEGEPVGDLPVVAQRNLDNGGVVIVFGSEKVFDITSVTMFDNSKFAENLFSDIISASEHKEGGGSSNSVFYLAGAGLVVVVIVASVLLSRKGKKGSAE